MKFRLALILVFTVCVVLGGDVFLIPQSAQHLIPANGSVREKNFDKLIETAEKDGQIPVILGFNADFTPEGELSAARKSDQRTEIEDRQAAILSKLEPFKPENIKRFSGIPYLAVNVDSKALEFLRSSPEITSIRKVERLSPTLAESTVVTGATTAWSRGFTGAGSVIAILDTGVDKTHPFLSGKVVSEACYSTTSAEDGTASICPGGASSSTAANSGLNCTFTSTCNHGTHVAGIAAGQFASDGLQGVARGADIVAIQVFSRVTTTNGVDGFDSDLILALERILTLKQGGMNIVAANMSLGDSARYASNCDATYPDMKAAIDNLRSVGVASVFSAGNRGFTDGTGYPACISSAVSVGSTGDGSGGSTVDVISSFSNNAPILHLLAPGQFITSSIPGGTFGGMSGTSMAAPHVAGAWAVLKQRSPNASVSQLLDHLRLSGQSVLDVRNGLTKPRINVAAALCYSSIDFAQVVNGVLTNSDCTATGGRFYDAFAFTGKEGQRISVSLTGPIDTYLTLLDANGQVVTQDNDGGGGTNARIPATSGYYILPANGGYSIYATSNLPGVTGAYSLNLTTPPVASMSGRVTTPQGLGVRNATVTMTDQAGLVRRATTSSFGNFLFDNVAIGEGYFLSVASKRYRFASRSVQVDGNLTGLDFIGLE